MAIGSPIGHCSSGRLCHDVSEPQVYALEAAHSTHNTKKKTAKPRVILRMRPEGGSILIKENMMLIRAVLSI
jgi:hypothetical protein